MPFSYEVPLPELAQADVQHAVLVEWLRPVRAWVEAQDAIVRVRCGAAQYDILVNGPGVLAEHRRSVGATLRPGDVLAIMHADGESIPYDRPYSLARAT